MDHPLQPEGVLDAYLRGSRSLVRLLLCLYILVLTWGCRSTNLRGDGAGLSGLRTTTSEFAVLAFLGEVRAAQPKKSWHFFRINQTHLLTMNSTSGEVSHFDIGPQVGRVVRLRHPETGKDWFLEIREELYAGSLEVDAWTTLAKTQAETWGALPERSIQKSMRIPMELRHLVLNRLLEDLRLLKYEFSPMSTKAVLTQLRKLARELPDDVPSTFKLKAALKEVASFIKEHESLYPIPVIEAWQNSLGEIEAGTLVRGDHPFLGGWPNASGMKFQFKVVKGDLVQLDNKIRDHEGIKDANNVIEVVCKSEKLLPSTAQARFELAKELSEGKRKIVFYAPDRASWQPFSAYKLEERNEYYVLETPGSAHDFGVHTGRVAIGKGDSKQVKHHKVLNFYHAGLGSQAYAIEMENSQTLLMKDGGEYLEYLFWDGSTLQSQRAVKIELSEFYESMSLSAPEPANWCSIGLGLK